jgi:hypothetical protein
VEEKEKMRLVRLNHVVKKRYTDIGASALLCLGMASAFAQSADIVDVGPGTTTQLDIKESSEDCSTDASVPGGDAPTAVCSADADAPDGPQLRITALSLPNTSGQRALSVATLSRSIQIPMPTSGPYSPVLPVQIATEVAWSGGAIVAGIETTFEQVVGTFQLRDITDAATESPGPVVASDTFLFERTDADFEIPVPTDYSGIAGFVNLVEFVDISNSSGADVTALLERGRTYRIELEAKCEVEVPYLGYGVCLFSKDAQALLPGLVTPAANGFPAWDNDGFAVSDITVTVGSDPVQGLAVTP